MSTRRRVVAVAVPAGTRRLPKAQRRPPSRTAWSARTEAQSLALPADLLRQARANTRKAATDVAFLAGLAREIALTRGAELTLAYRNLVWVLPGFRKRQQAGRTRIDNLVCVVFVVKRKGGVAPGAEQHLPAWLLTFADREGERQVFALPTDVQDAADFHGAQVQSDSGVWVRNGDWPVANGSLTCLVSLREGAAQQTCILSAQHVLTPFADGDALQVRGGLALWPLDAAGKPADQPRLGTSLPHGGVLRGDERPDRPSFDVQLAAIAPGGDTAVQQRIALRRLHPARPWVRSLADLLVLDRDGWFHLLAPDNHASVRGRGAIRLTLGAMPPLSVPIPYPLAGEPQAARRNVFHAELLRFDATGAVIPLPGDSGSPIVFRHPDGTMTLVAMHIAGNGLGLSWAIPAWRLFDLQNWAQYPAGARIEPVDA
jgi:hypothetical protein